MSRRSCLVALALVALTAGMAEAKPRKYSWEIFPFVGTRDYDSAMLGMTTHGIYGVRVGFNLTRHWEVEAGWSNDAGNHDRTLFHNHLDAQTIDVGAVINFNTGADKHQTHGRWTSWDRWIPYVTAGVGNFDLTDDFANARQATTGFIGGGTRIMVAPTIGIRFDVRDVVSMSNGDFGQSFANPEASIGASFILGGPVPRDSDSDGVIDGLDKCPGTPLGCWVDEKGCPRDADGDGVCDGLDRCPNTPAGCPVDEHGCPLDGDGDGVCDGLDNCPGTPTGCWVDEHGCPKDSDKDGVCDGIDKCPDTPEGCKVDATGCPLDGDGDGVCDGIDKCPDTPRGVKVDAVGCPIEVAKLVLANVYFEFNKSDIRSFYQAVLDEVAKSLLQSDWRILEIELRGHTDSVDSVDYNYRLGQARADSVKDYLVARGVPPARLVTKSFSELEPAAPNTKPDGTDNPEGRMLNRRVEMVPTSPVPADRTRSVKVVMRDIMFKSGSSDLSDDGKRYLDELAEGFGIDELKAVQFEVTGSAKGAKANDLASRRADSVATYLQSKGIARERIRSMGGGTGADKATVVPVGSK